MLLYIAIVYSFLLLCSVLLCDYMSLFIHSAIDKHRRSAIVILSEVDINIQVYILLWMDMFLFLLPKHLEAEFPESIMRV